MVLTASVEIHPEHNNPYQSYNHNLFVVRINLDGKEVGFTTADFVTVFYESNVPSVCDYDYRDPDYPYPREEKVEISILAKLKGHTSLLMENLDDVNCSAVKSLEHEGMGDEFNSVYDYCFEEDE